MKKLVSLFAVLTLSITVFACDLQDLMSGHTSLAQTIRQYTRQGYTIVEGDQTFYSQHRYFAMPTPPYVDGAGQVTMMKSNGNMSLQTTYVTISFEGYVTKQNKCTANITDISTSVVY